MPIAFKIHQNKIIIGASLLVLCIIFVVVIVLLARNSSDNSYPRRMSVFFFNREVGQLEPESRPWPSSYENRYYWINEVLRHLVAGPNSSQLLSTWPNTATNDFITDFQIYDCCRCDEDCNFCGELYSQNSSLNEEINKCTCNCPTLLVINFSQEYDVLLPLDEALFRSALTLTMMGLPFVDEVMLITPTTTHTETLRSISNNPEISPERLSDTIFTLFFIDETYGKLVREVRSVPQANIQRRAEVAFQQLILGTNSPNLISTIPPSTRIISVETVPEAGVSAIYVNLSGEFLRFNGNTAQARLMLASIVHTVLEAAPDMRMRQVFFLIDSQRIENFHGITGFSSAFVFDETLMLDYLETYQDYTT